jgi:DNA-binding LacI/PurR family transcriptional regulator
MMAFGAMDAARSCFGLRIPEDLLIMGFDGGEEAARTVYRLSTIRQPLTEMVEAAVDLVIRQVDGAPLVRVLPTSLILRESTGRRSQP